MWKKLIEKQKCKLLLENYDFWTKIKIIEEKKWRGKGKFNGFQWDEEKQWRITINSEVVLWFSM